MTSFDNVIHDPGQHRADNDPEEHIPVEERNTVPCWQCCRCVKRHPQGGDEGNDEQDIPCLLPLATCGWLIGHAGLLSHRNATLYRVMRATIHKAIRFVKWQVDRHVDSRRVY